MVRFEREQAALRRGDLREAIRRLRSWDPATFSREERRLHRVLLAEVLLYTADRTEAVRLAASVIADEADASLQARALVVRGVAHADAGNVAAAIETLRKAVAVAKETGAATDMARTQIRLASALAEHLAGPQLAALVPEAHASVVRAGDPHLTAYFYITESRIEAKAGAIDEAWRHLDLADALLPVEPNHVLDALHAFTAAALCLLGCHYTEAVRHGRRALHHARAAGYTRLLPGALGNLALSLVNLGHVDEAETLLDEALVSPSLSTQAEVALLDSKAQLCLLRHDVPGCQVLLERIGRMAGAMAVQEEWNWASLSRHETRTRLALLRGEVSDAATLAATGRHAAMSRGDRVHGALFAALEADARLRDGDADTARELLDASTSYDPSLPLAVLVERERVRANMARVTGETAGAEHARRAARLVDAAGTAQQRDSLLRDGHIPTTGGWADEVPVPRDPTENGVLTTLDAIGHLVACSRHRALFAMEIAALLDGVPGIAAVRHVVYDADDRVVVGRELRGSRGAGERPAATWSLGVDRDGRHELEAWANTGAARVGLAALGPVVEAVCALVESRRRGASSAVAWGPATAPDALTGVFGGAMRAQVDLVMRAAATALPVLLTGETGTGKELVARELHRLSRSASGPFVPFNCAAIPREMLESQLFGHRRGAFTGASADFSGVVREAAGGTLFLDEIAELDVTLQPKLLRFLETGELQRLGEARPVSVDVRTLAATNADVPEMLRTGRFREDLFYRLNVIHLHLPPLRERRDDVPALARHFLDRFGRELGKPPLRLTDSSLELLTLYDWPGNVRELLNEMRRLTAFAEPDELITPERLSRGIRTRALESARRNDEVVTLRVDQSLDDATAALQRAFVARAFRMSSGRVGEAATLLGVSRKGLFLMRRRLGLE